MGKLKKLATVEQCLTQANSLYTAGKLGRALRYCQAALEIEPDNPLVWYNLGTLYKASGQVDKAIGAYRRVMAINPIFSRAYNELGVVLREEARYDEAIEILKKGIEVDPRIPQLHNNLGNVLGDVGRYKEEADCYRRALTLDAGYAIAWGNLATCLCAQGDNQAALVNYEKALSLSDKSADLYQAYGTILQEVGRVAEARVNYQKAVELDPSSARALNSLFLIKRQLCEWSGLDQIERRLDELGHEDPFTSITRCEDPKKNFEVAREWSEQLVRKAGGGRFPFEGRESRRGRKIRLGYLSNDLRDHPIGQMVAPLSGLHDRERFEVYVYPYGKNDASIYRQMAERGADKLTDLRGLTDDQAARVIYDDEVDILIDITGYTLGNRLGVCARRPAGLQVSWLGFPGTSGAAFFDYVIVDKIIAPESEAVFFSEKLAYLPHCYQMNNNTIKIAKKNWIRKNFGLPEKGFVFASFNQAYKIEPAMFDVWMEILSRAPGSVLWLWEQDKEASENLRKEAGARGVPPSRLVFAGRLPKEEHLARIRLADLGLDTRVYGGHTTTADFLWAGVPVVTALGTHFASRVCAGLLTEAGVPELVTKDLKEYEELAVELAKKPRGLEEMKGRLTSEKLKRSLYNTDGFVKDLEEVYTSIWNEVK